MAINNLGTAASFATRNNPTLTGTVDMSAATLVKGAGMDLITPTSVAGTGVTLSGGQVIIAAASSASVNGCFTSAYDNYLLMMKISASVANTVSCRMRLAGTDNTANSYYSQRLYSSSTSVTASALTSTSARMGDASTDTDPFCMQIFSPALAESTSGLQLNAYQTRSTAGTLLGSFGHNVLTAFDGITVFVPSGTITGTLRIYGLRNS